MTQPQKNNQTIEDQLADYTDSILAEETVKQDEATFAPDPDLRALEQTALRLKSAFGTDDPEEAVIQRIHTNIMRQWHQPGRKTNQTALQNWVETFKPSGPKWRSQRSRQRLNLALSLATLALLLLVSIPFVGNANPGQPGASGQNSNVYILLALGGLVLLAVWLFRRKP